MLIIRVTVDFASSNSVFPRWNNCAEARPHQSIDLSCSWWRILCRRRDVEYWFLYTMYMPQWACPVWDWSLPTSSLSKPHPHTGLLLSTVPRYILTISFHRSPLLIWECGMWILNVSVCARLVVVVPLFFSGLVWEPAVLYFNCKTRWCARETLYVRGVVALKFDHHLWRKSNNVRVAWEPESLVGRFMKYVLARLWKYAGLEQLWKQSKGKADTGLFLFLCTCLDFYEPFYYYLVYLGFGLENTSVCFSLHLVWFESDLKATE